MYRAYAKINLGLIVQRKREDGYHDIQTLFHRVNIYDEIAIERSDSLVVKSTDPAAPAGPANIGHTAASMLQRHLGTSAGATISITKHIPVGAGLGGGSSDAAVILCKLPALWGAHITDADLRAIALELGSDVPYFLERGSALAGGRGEQLHYFSLDIPFGILLCNPGIHVATPWAYQNVRPAQRSVDLKKAIIDGLGQPQHWVHAIVNDFEPVVFGKYPLVKEIKETMLLGGATFALMSGSGSSVFGLFGDSTAMEHVARDFASRGYRVFLTPSHFSPSE